MYSIHFYRDKNGREPVLEYLQELMKGRGKENRIKFRKVTDYIELLGVHGTYLGEPYIKHLEGDIWELRPLRDRILFVGWTGGRFTLLHPFTKQTQKTPRREIERAKRELSDLKNRGILDES